MHPLLISSEEQLAAASPPQVTTSKSEAEHESTFHRSPRSAKRTDVTVRFRPATLDDEQRLRDFFTSHTEETIYLRYGMMQREMTHVRAVQLLQLDGHTEFALVGLVCSSGPDRIIAIGRYILDEVANLAEVAFVVHEDYRGMGIATHILSCLVGIVREHGFSGVTAQVLSRNAPMMKALHEVLGVPDETSSGCGEETLCWHFELPK